MQIQTLKAFSWKLRSWNDDMNDETLFLKFPVYFSSLQLLKKKLNPLKAI